METITDQSYGVIPVFKKDGDWQVLLVHQISYRGKNDRFWTFPKGHSEGEETPIETAKRELVEETGVTDVHIYTDARFATTYTFTHEGKRIEKTVTYFLGVCARTSTTISIPEEIADLQWFSFKEAGEKLTHKNSQQLLLAAGAYINQHLQLV